MGGGNDEDEERSNRDAGDTVVERSCMQLFAYGTGIGSPHARILAPQVYNASSLQNFIPTIAFLMQSCPRRTTAPTQATQRPKIPAKSTISGAAVPLMHRIRPGGFSKARPVVGLCIGKPPGPDTMHWRYRCTTNTDSCRYLRSLSSLCRRSGPAWA